MTSQFTHAPDRAPVLCIGAGIEQLHAIRVAQTMGLHVTAIDGNPHAPGLQVADQGHVIDLRDQEAVIALARQVAPRTILPVPLGSIITTVGAVNDALELRGISAGAARQCTDKLLMAATLKEAGLFSPRSLPADDEASITAAAERMGWPVIVKPTDGSGSRGVFACHNLAELQHWLPWHYQQRQEHSRTQPTLVQQFIMGREVGIDGVMIDGKFALLMIRDKEVTAQPFRLPYAFLAPAELEPQNKQRLQETLSAACQAITLDDCLVHADVILGDQGEVAIIDLSGRPSGFNISARMAPCVLGFDPVEQMLRHNLGEPACFENTRMGAAVLRFLSATPGKLVDVKGLSEARQLPGIVAAESFLAPGETIHPRRSGQDGYRVGYLLARGNNRSEAEQHWQTANQTISFLVEHNDDANQQEPSQETQHPQHDVWCQNAPGPHTQLSD